MLLCIEKETKQEARMLIRNISKHIKEQNWTAVFLDLIVVVVGIFLGLQVSNLNTQRIKNNELDHYMQDLATEFNNSREMTINQIHWQTRVIDGLQLTLNTLEGYEPKDNELEQIYFALSVSGAPPYFANKKEVLLEMQNTGAIQLLPRGDLRSALMESLAQYRQAEAYYEKVVKQVTAAPFSYSIVTWGQLKSEKIQYEGQVVAEHVNFELARKDPEFYLRVIQGIALFTSIRFMNWFNHQEHTLVLNMLSDKGFQAQENWLNKNIEFLISPPKNKNWKLVGEKAEKDE